MNRSQDWWNQANRDLRHARHARTDEDHEWACFAAQQAAEKAVKAVVLAAGGEPWGHSVAALLESLPTEVRPESTTMDAGRRLDKHYVPARYPNGLPAGHPGASYTKGEADEAIRDAEAVLAFCGDRLARP